MMDKPSYSLFSNTKYLYQLQWKYSKLSFVFMMSLVPVSLALSYLHNTRSSSDA
jgi:lipopolysaccharide export LptBFGC system permease protein LptF